MLHVIDADNRKEYADTLEQSFIVRHRVFVEQKGWLDLRKPDGRETDQFDTDAAIHMVWLDDDGNVVAGSRLLPTTEPHLLSEIFPHLATVYDIPRSPKIFEWTRFYVDHGNMANVGECNLSSHIMCGVLQYCLDHEITHLSAVAEALWLSRFLRWGWKPEALGLPQDYSGQKIVGLVVKVSEEALEKTARATRVSNTILYRHTGQPVQFTE